jgi:rod shape-determining protein MreC
VVVGWILFLGQPTTVSTKVRMIFVQLCTPFVKLTDSIPVIHWHRNLEKANEQLRADNANLLQQNRALAETGRENLRLQRLLNLKEHLTAKTIGARVIGRDASNWWKSIQIDRGQQDGVSVNCAVCSADGVIGKTVTVTKGQSRVLLLIDPNCKAGAVLQDCRQPGIVAGVDEPFGRVPRLQMMFVDRDAKIKTGEAIYTSGLGGVFPKGILIGTVAGAKLNAQSGMYQDVEVKPSADFQRLEEVLVILP